MQGKCKSILIVGGPGAGKGTQGEMLGKREGYLHFSSGDMFRGLDTTTDLGREVGAWMKRGELVPDDLTVRLFDETLGRYISACMYDPRGDVLVPDGIPRTRGQVVLMKDRLDIRQILYLDAPNEVLVERLKGRGVLEGRADDQDPEVIERRIEIYREETSKEVLGEYDPGLIVPIDASGTIEEVHQAILRVVIS